MGMFSKERKGMNCVPEPDGAVVCRRVIKNNKTGELLTDGQEARISADPQNNCQPRFDGNMTILDDEFPEFEKVAGRVSQGCHKANQQQNPTEGQ